MQLHRRSDGTWAPPVITGLFCDPLGRFRGNLVPEPSLPTTVRDLVKQTARGVQRWLAERHHIGRAGFDAMNRCIAANRIEPVVSDRFALEDLAKACDLMEAGGHFGKIAITLP